MRHPDETYKLGPSFLPGTFCNHTIPGLGAWIEFYRAMETMFGHRQPYARYPGRPPQDDESSSHILQPCPECGAWMHPASGADIWTCDNDHSWSAKVLHERGLVTKGPLLCTFEVD